MRILIAEDEYYARKALERNIREWDQDAEVICADNGVSALERLRGNDVDILLLDIKMPQMDGLTLAAQLMQEGIDVYTIITSGYSDFDFARQAMRSGVREYLLKPINPDMLCETLETAYDEISRREQERIFDMDREGMLRRQQMRMTLAWLQSSAVPCPEHLSHLVARSAGCFAAVFFGGAQDRAAGMLEERLEAQGMSLCPYIQEARWMGALIVSADGEKQPQDVMRDLLKGLPQDLRAAVSGMFAPSEASAAYRQAQLAYGMRCLEDARVLTGEMLSRRTEYINLQDTEQSKAFFYQLLQRKPREAQASLQAMLRPLLEESSASPYCIQDVLNHICAQINRASAQMGQERSPGAISGVTLRLEEIDSREQLYARLSQMIQTTCELQSEEKISHSQEIVALIRDYIDEHFSENVSLKTLANTKLYMNVSYLSRLFKSATGKSFRTYLTDVRMHKAAQMLALRDDSITHIAVDCGYTDVSHFIQLFRRRYGATPNAYREACAGHPPEEGPDGEK